MENLDFKPIFSELEKIRDRIVKEYMEWVEKQNDHHLEHTLYHTKF